MPVIALITDFGEKNWFAGEMKGVIYGISPDATVIDITHQIPPGGIRTACFTLLACYSSFPQGTVFCNVVDPGVGSSRKAIAASNGKYFFVGPDNGVLSWVFLKENVRTVTHLTNSTFFRHPVSSTFHGRDIFAPVSAHLSSGVSLEKLGTQFSDFKQITFPASTLDNGKIIGEIICIDSFGNLITSIGNDMITPEYQNSSMKILKTGETLLFGRYFQEFKPLDKLFYTGSAGFVEIAVNGGNASEVLEITVGDRVEITAPDPI
ncbi:MAG TPA: SAM-dependent chlorinase/fluorinase [Chitinispirillaceae bacterium]|nr:SAM-dependent chlorinase/fluorinase [Chitinispirillaceae bacterium]